MKYWYQKTHPSISPYVRTVLILEGFAEADTASLPLVTYGMPALICRMEKDGTGNENITDLKLYGKSTPSDCWEINISTTIIAYFFKPFALATVFDVPAKQLVKDPVDLFLWNAHKINAVRTQLIYAGTTTYKVDVLDNLLIHQVEQNRRECEIIQFATDQIMCDPGTAILSVMLEKLNLTERTFQRIFKKYVGITATQYRRIAQFQFSFEQLRAQKFNKLTDIAFDSGFADQSHFIRSFREFTQLTPNDYLKLGLKEKNK